MHEKAKVREKILLCLKAYYLAQLLQPCHSMLFLKLQTILSMWSIYSTSHSTEAFEQRPLLLTGMWRHLFSRVLQNITQSPPWISNSIKVAWHSLSNYESSGHLIYNCSFSWGLPSHVKSFLSIICQRWFLVNSFDECTNCVYFNVIRKIEGFLLWGYEKPKSRKTTMSRHSCIFFFRKLQIMMAEQHLS